MSEIQQIYCTHCTYGSSALERSEGELASRVLEYGPRASSLSAGKLREYYRQIEPLLYYALPADMPAAEKLAATADSAPRRLFYCPSIENLQVLGQVCFRPKDTMGRHGSYFAHLLVGEPPQARWPVPQCAQAWGAAAWVREDSANHLHDLPRLADLASFCGTPVLGDPLLLGFLTEPKGSRFFDQQELIAPRWKLKDPAVRQRLLVDLLAAYLDIAASPSRRESAIVVVEPEVAALLFYGVARLLPEGPIRQNISFSTFEPHADRLTAVALAATTFHQPQTSDLAPEFYQGQNFVFNTFLGRSSSRRPSGTHYASLVVQDFMAGKDAGAGPNGVGELLRSFQAVQPASPHELALLAQAHALVPGLLDPKRPLPKELWQEESKARDYLALAAARQLGRLPVHSPDLRALVGTARQMELLRLVSRLPDADPQRGGVRLLLWSLPEPWFGALVGSAQVRPDFKLEALLHFVAQEKALPKEWDMVPRAGGQKARLTADSVKDLLMQLLGRLDPSLVPGVLRGLSPEQFGALMGDVLQSGPPDQKKNDMLLFLEQLPDDDLVTVLARLGERVFLAYPRERTVLRERLQSLLDDLHSHPADFDRRLDVLWKCKEHFPNPGAAEEQMDHWRKVREKLLEIRGHLQRQGSLSVTALLGSEAVDFSQIGETLAKELGFAIPDDRVPPSPEDSRAEFLARYKLECLRDIGEVMVGTPGFLPDDVFQDIFNAFKGIAWPSKQLSKARKGSAIGRLGGRSRNVGRPRRRTPTWLKTFSIFLAPFLLVGGAIVLVAVVNPFGADSRFAHLRQSVEHAGSTPAPDPLAEKVPGAKPPPPPPLVRPVEIENPRPIAPRQTAPGGATFAPSTTPQPPPAGQTTTPAGTPTTAPAAEPAQTPLAPGAGTPRPPSTAPANPLAPANPPAPPNPLAPATPGPSGAATSPAPAAPPPAAPASPPATSSQAPPSAEAAPPQSPTVSYCDLPPSQETKVVELANLGKPPDADAATNAAIDKSLDLLGDQDLGARLQLVRQLPTLAVYDLVDLSATPRQLAVFSVYFERGKAKLRFAWGGSAAGERNQLKKLADCVVQVELRGAETRSHLVALAKPTPLDRVRLDQGTGQVKRSSLPDEVFDEVAWQKRLAEAYLGGGKLHLSDKSTVDFFDGPAVARRRVVHPSLAKRLNATQVVVEYASGIFKVLAEYDPAQADARSQKAELVAKRAARKQQDDYRRWVLQQKATFEDAARATDEKRYAAAVAIGRQLLSEDLPPAPEDRDELKLRLSEWRMKINNAATTRAVALEEQIAALDGQIQALEAAIPPEVRDAEDLSIVTGLSATLYRNVEGVRVDTVILGTP